MLYSTLMVWQYLCTYSFERMYSVHFPNINAQAFQKFLSILVLHLTISSIFFSHMKFWSKDIDPSASVPIGLDGNGISVFLLFFSERWMSAPQSNFRQMHSETSFIEVKYVSVLYPPKQSNKNPLRYFNCDSNLSGWGYVVVLGLRLQADLVREGFDPAPLSTFMPARLLIII